VVNRRPRLRLSANVPRHWLFDREWRAMPDDARTLWVSACQMCIGETNGAFTEADLGLMLPVDAARRQAALEWLLASRGAFRFAPQIRGGGWCIPNWTDHNSAVATVENHRRRERVKKAKKRARPAPMSPGGVPTGDQRLKAKELSQNNAGTVTNPTSEDDWHLRLVEPDPRDSEDRGA
jgi:hypothetical protein